PTAVQESEHPESLNRDLNERPVRLDAVFFCDVWGRHRHLALTILRLHDSRRQARRRPAFPPTVDPSPFSTPSPTRPCSAPPSPVRPGMPGERASPPSTPCR